MITLVMPPFWYKRGAAAWLLWPLTLLYRLAVLVRRAGAVPYRASMPVICIGNAVAGGAGKTPLAIHTMRRVIDLKLAARPCFLTRGYKGAEKGPVMAATSHEAHDIGDEALLLSRHGPVIVARNRAAGLRLAARQGFDLVIADDGLQNPNFHKDLSILAIDGAFGFGNRMLLPAGPLRDSLPRVFRQCRAAVVTGADTQGAIPALPIPRFDAQLAPVATAMPVNLYAFAGIGRPDKFFTTLRDAGHVLAGAKAYPDHYTYTDASLERMVAEARKTGATLVTTEKDWVRLSPRWRTQVRAFPVALQLDDAAGFDAMLAAGLGK